MAIAKMLRAEFVSARSDKLALLNYLQETGVTSIEEDAELAEALTKKGLCSSVDTARFRLHEYKVFADLMSTQRRPDEAVHLLNYTVSKKTLQELVSETTRWRQRIERVLKVLDPLSEEKKPLFRVRREISLEDRYMGYPEQVEIHEQIIRLEEIHDDYQRTEQNLAGMKTHLRGLEPWKRLQLPRAAKSSHVSTTAGYFDRREDYDALIQTAEQEKIALAADVYFTTDEGALAVLLAWAAEDEEPVRRLLAASALRAFPATTDTERKGDFMTAYEQQLSRIDQAEKDFAQAGEELKAGTAHIKALEKLYDVLGCDLSKLEALIRVSNSPMLSAFSGFVPAALAPRINRELAERFAVVTAFSEPDPDDESVPTLLVNSDAVSPVEAVINTFSPPNYRGDTDPAFIMSLTYAFFFGSMLSDIGYGLILTLFCLISVYKLKAEGTTRKMLLVFGAGGAVSIIFGILYGSFFGNLLPALTNNAITLKPLWFDPMSDPITLMIASVIFGAVHLFIGLGFDIKNKIRDGNWHDALFGVAPWYFVIIGAGLLALKVPFAMYVLLFGVAVIFLLSPTGKNPFLRIFSGLGALYSVTGWLGDLLSYTRILALTLATSVIAMVVNMMAGMIGVTGPTVIFAVIVLIFGHGLNLALSVLSAYVHATRLHYVEFFGRFYVGGGETFRPLGLGGYYTRVSDVKPLSVRSEKK